MDGTIKLKGKPPAQEPLPPPANTEREFIKNFLAGGPIMRTYVFREVDNAGLSWEKVKEEFFKLDGREYVQKGEYFWRTYPE